MLGIIKWSGNPWTQLLPAEEMSYNNLCIGQAEICGPD